MKIRVNVDKVAALKAGKDRYGLFVVEVPAANLSEAEREVLARYTYPKGSGKDKPEADFYLDHIRVTDPEGWTAIDVGKDIVEADEAAVHTILVEIIALDTKIAAKKAEDDRKRREEEEAEIREVLVKSPEDLIYDMGCGKWHTLNAIRKHRDDPRVAPLHERAQALAAERTDRYRKAKAERARREEEEADAREARRQAQIGAWVEKSGTASQRKRFSEGLLPVEEFERAERDRLFAPLEGFAPYERIKASDVCECEYEEPCRVDFEAEDATGLTEEEFATLEAIRAAVPGAVVKPRVHRGESSRCELVLERKSAHVTITEGEFTFTREYAL